MILPTDLHDRMFPSLHKMYYTSYGIRWSSDLWSTLFWAPWEREVYLLSVNRRSCPLPRLWYEICRKRVLWKDECREGYVSLESLEIQISPYTQRKIRKMRVDERRNEDREKHTEPKLAVVEVYLSHDPEAREFICFLESYVYSVGTYTIIQWLQHFHKTLPTSYV